MRLFPARYNLRELSMSEKKASVGIDATAIRQLADLLTETGLHEIEYETEAMRIRVAKSAPVAYAAAPAAVMAPAAASSAAAVAPEAHPGTVKAPMVGVTYLSPEPGASAFIQVGQQVSEGQTLLLIEAMKTFNPVRAPRAGKVTQILVADAQPVEYGEPLVVIE